MATVVSCDCTEFYATTPASVFVIIDTPSLVIIVQYTLQSFLSIDASVVTYSRRADYLTMKKFEQWLGKLKVGKTLDT